MSWWNRAKEGQEFSSADPEITYLSLSPLYSFYFTPFPLPFLLLKGVILQRLCHQNLLIIPKQFTGTLAQLISRCRPNNNSGDSLIPSTSRIDFQARLIGARRSSLLYILGHFSALYVINCSPINSSDTLQ